MDVVFPVMPFADTGRPSMGVSLLSAEARAAGYSTSVKYLNLALAEQMGLELYQKVATSFPPNMLVGEWFFADCCSGATYPARRNIWRTYSRRVSVAPEIVPKILALRKRRSELS